MWVLAVRERIKLEFKTQTAGSVVLYVKTDSGNTISNHHFVMARASQWIVGQDLTTKYSSE